MRTIAMIGIEFKEDQQMFSPSHTKSSRVGISIVAAILFTFSAAPALAQSLSNSIDVDGDGHYRFGAYHGPKTGAFQDSWQFSLAEKSRIDLAVKSLDLTIFKFPILGIDDLSLTLGSDSVTGRQWLSAVLPASDYQFTVAGEVEGFLGGLYKGKLKVAAVPLPPAMILLGSALLVLTGVARRRSLQANA